MVALENFLASTKEISVQELEYVPYQRLVLAHLLDEECGGSLKKILVETLHDRATGALEISTPPDLNKDNLIKISTPAGRWVECSARPLHHRSAAVRSRPASR